MFVSAMSEEEDIGYIDDDFDESKHDKMVEQVLSLNKVQNLKKPSRTEPSLKISEFNLVKSLSGKKDSVRVEDLTKVLKSRKKHIQIEKRVSSANRKSRTLPRPLEKPQSERIRRSVGYEKNRFLFDRWEAFVTSNRAQSHQIFPLDSIEKIKVETKEAVKFPETWKVKSDLQKELEKLETPVEEYIIDEEANDDFPLTLKDLRVKRKEAAKLRAHQSFKEAKARQQNKIKSKKYHRILRKEKIKQKLKEFEELQKSDPEGALKKLEEIERARALERFSLRHKSTGQWAKSKQFRAKYDKESRQILAQQLQISRDLTQKHKNNQSDSEDENYFINPQNDEEFTTHEICEMNLQNEDIPWTNTKNASKDVSISYKKYWSDQNANINKNEGEPVSVNVKNSNIVGISDKNAYESNSECFNNSSGEWDIDDIFNQAEMKIEEKLKRKLKENLNVRKDKSKNMVCKKKMKSSKKIKKVDLTIPSKNKKQIIDEEMIEKSTNVTEDGIEKADDIIKLRRILDSAETSKKGILKKSIKDIDPERFTNPKTNKLDSAAPDLIIKDDNIDENNRKDIMTEAFEDNDNVKDFTKEKKEEMDKDKPKDIDLNLPGWGSWAGTGINTKKQRKRKRFIVKMPEVLPRRDDNKGSLIINEKAAVKVKPHLVSEVPFPFKTVKDYEASIRAPIGNTFVPEIAFRKYIKPAVETKMGTIIEPVTTSVLMGKTNR